MSQITAIITQKKRPDRVNIFLDGEFWSGSPDWAVKDLCVGDVLNAQELDELTKKIAGAEALQWAIWYLNRWTASEKQIKDKLLRKGWGESVINHVIGRCKEYGYLNDQIYGENIIASAIEAGRSRRWVNGRLRQKGISEELAKSLMDQNYPEDKEQEALEIAIQKGASRDPDRLRAQLLRGGFSPGAVFGKIPRNFSEQKFQQRVPREEDLDKAIRKYGDASPKAVAFLMRRGWSAVVARQALESGKMPED